MGLAFGIVKGTIRKRAAKSCGPMHFSLLSAAFLRPLVPSPSSAYSVGDSSAHLRAVMRGGGGGGVSVGGAVGSPVAAQVDVWNWRDGTGKGTSFETLVAEAKRAHKSRHKVEVHVGADSAVDRVSHTPHTSKGSLTPQRFQPPKNHHRPPDASSRASAGPGHLRRRGLRRLRRPRRPLLLLAARGVAADGTGAADPATARGGASQRSCCRTCPSRMSRTC